MNFLAKYGMCNSMPKGRKMLCAEIACGEMIVAFRGSSSLLPMKLSSFGGVFGLKVHKELSRATKSRSRELAGQS